MCSILALGLGAPLLLASGAASAAAQPTNRVLSDPDTPTLGNRDGTVTVVEFFDYRCPYCRLMEPILADALKDTRVRLLLKEWPIFGGVSLLAARVALAAHWQGRFAAVHHALFGIRGPMSEQSVRIAARAAGANMDRLENDLAARGAELDATLAFNASEARRIGFSGTPGLLVDRLVVPGAVSGTDLTALIEEAAHRGQTAGQDR